MSLTFDSYEALRNAPTQELLEYLLPKAQLNQLKRTVRSSDKDDGVRLTRIVGKLQPYKKEQKYLLVAFEVFARAMREGLYISNENLVQSIGTLIRAIATKYRGGESFIIWFDETPHLLKDQIISTERISESAVNDGAYHALLMQSARELNAASAMLVERSYHSGEYNLRLGNARRLKSLIGNPLSASGITVLGTMVTDGVSVISC